MRIIHLLFSGLKIFSKIIKFFRFEFLFKCIQDILYIHHCEHGRVAVAIRYIYIIVFSPLSNIHTSIIQEQNATLSCLQDFKCANRIKSVRLSVLNLSWDRKTIGHCLVFRSRGHCFEFRWFVRMFFDCVRFAFRATPQRRIFICITSNGGCLLIVSSDWFNCWFLTLSLIIDEVLWSNFSSYYVYVTRCKLFCLTCFKLAKIYCFHTFYICRNL